MVQPISGLVPQKIGIRRKLPDNQEPKGVPFSIDFSVMASPQNIDLSSTQIKNTLGHVKSMFVDNSGNTASLNILSVVTRQTITIPAGSQAYMPVASTADQFQITTTGAVLVGLDFFNVDIEPCVWSATPGNSLIGSVLFAGSAGIDHSANPLTYPPAGHSIIKSVGANTSRALIGVQNQSADQIQVWRTGESGAMETLILLETGGAANTGGGAWTSQTFKGAIEIWVPTANAGTDQVSVYED
jgi:hypothetical protein